MSGWQHVSVTISWLRQTIELVKSGKTSWWQKVLAAKCLFSCGGTMSGLENFLVAKCLVGKMFGWQNVFGSRMLGGKMLQVAECFFSFQSVNMSSVQMWVNPSRRHEA